MHLADESQAAIGCLALQSVLLFPLKMGDEYMVLHEHVPIRLMPVRERAANPQLHPGQAAHASS